jgi:transposase-like protein
MAKVHYVECALCGKEYYLDRILSEVVEANPKQKLKCPFCKKEFLKDGKGKKEKVTRS